MARLKLDNDEDEKRKGVEKAEFKETMERYKEFREKVREGEKEEERRMHDEYMVQC